MASIIKNQLIKHLSKFTRNLKPEQISLDVLKGNSKLQFIEINEEVLTEILELPSWLKIKRAYCTGVTVSVPWTRLKSSPIEIFIDEINVDVELSSGATGKRGENPLGSYADNSSYGFANKVVENMSLYINTVEINFDSDAFGGSFMLSRLSVESRSPAWLPVKDLRQTRITCPISNRTLMYKHLSWHLLRVEASAKTSKDEKRSKINAPLRLITSGGKIRIALKKSSIDGAVIHARIQTVLEDILWVATLPQLRSAISFASYIMDLVKKSQNDAVATLVPMPAGSNRLNNLETPGAASTSTNFRTFYFDQTSYHLYVKKIDLHLCDDAHTSNCYPPEWNIDSGAMQVTLFQVLIDAYPKSSATSDRFTWMNYQHENPIRTWMHSRLNEHYQKILATTKDSTMKTRLERCWPQLMGFHLVVRMYDLTVQCVSDMSTKKDALKNLFVSERHLRGLPSDQHIIHFELANYFHPMTDTLPVPKAATYLQLGPFSLSHDERTIRWCLYVAHSLSVVIEDNNLVAGIESDVETPDIRIELIMPKLIIPLPSTDSDSRLPHRLVLSMSTLSISSCQFEGYQAVRFVNMSEASVVKAAELNKTDCNLLKDIRAGTTPPKSELFYIRTSPVWIDTDHGINTKGLTLVYDIPFVGAIAINTEKIAAYIEPIEEVTLMIDHYQFLQLTRMLDTLSKFFETLTSDQKHFDESKNGKTSTTPLVEFLVNIEKIRAHICLTMGPLPSPYDSCPAVAESISFIESEVAAVTPRSNTPLTVRKTDALTVPKTNLPRNSTVENFPEFPRGPTDFDASSMIDDSVSVATSVEDDTNLDYEIAVNDDPFGNFDVAEEAVVFDENILNDRIYKSTMARVGNILQASISNVSVVGKSLAGSLEVNGGVRGVELSQVFGIVRQEAMDLLKKETNTVSNGYCESEDVVTFKLTAPPETSTSFLEANVKGLKAYIDDEILTHLSPFALDTQVTENKMHLTVNVEDSDISIVDRKKKKPLKMKIKSLIIEQEED